MKKSLKVLLVVFLVIASLVVLTGCGEKAEEPAQKEESNKENSTPVVEKEADLVATKTTEEEFGEDGETISYEEKIEISFKNDEVDTVKMSITFEDEETAETYVAQYNAMIELAKAFAEASEDESAESFNLPSLTLEGKVASMELNAEEYATLNADSEEEPAPMTKEAVKADLEAEGYEVTVK